MECRWWSAQAGISITQVSNSVTHNRFFFVLHSITWSELDSPKLHVLLSPAWMNLGIQWSKCTGLCNFVAVGKKEQCTKKWRNFFKIKLLTYFSLVSRVHRQIVTIFGSGIEDVSQQKCRFLKWQSIGKI